MTAYTRPTLSPEQQAQIRAALMQFERRPKVDLLAALAMFIAESARLWAECNEHRGRPWD